MRRIVYFLGGLPGSELFTQDFGAMVWPELKHLLLGRYKELALAPNGTDPAPDGGIELLPNRTVYLVYGRAIERLRRDLDPATWEVREWGWDWRKRATEAATLLTAEIRRSSSAESPATLVAHSTGGIVCRLAYRSLKLAGDAALVRRIVTLGTPHRGTYDPVKVWSLCHEMTRQLLYLANAVGVALLFSPAAPIARLWTPSGLAAVTATWPCLYDLLPYLYPNYQEQDPYRLYLFDASNWPADLGISQAHLDHARGITQPAMLDPDGLPPASVLTTVGSTGWLTHSALNAPSAIGKCGAMAVSGLGDDTVTIDSSVLAHSRQVIRADSHMSLPTTTSVNGDLTRWVLEDNPNPPPPPDKTAAGAPLPIVQQWPPLCWPIPNPWIDC